MFWRSSYDPHVLKVLCLCRSQRSILGSPEGPRLYGGPLDLQLGALLKDQGITLTASEKKLYTNV